MFCQKRLCDRPLLRYLRRPRGYLVAHRSQSGARTAVNQLVTDPGNDATENLRVYAFGHCDLSARLKRILSLRSSSSGTAEVTSASAMPRCSLAIS